MSLLFSVSYLSLFCQEDFLRFTEGSMIPTGGQLEEEIESRYFHAHLYQYTLNNIFKLKILSKLLDMDTKELFILIMTFIFTKAENKKYYYLEPKRISEFFTQHSTSEIRSMIILRSLSK